MAKKFRFKLQPVLRYRERIEEETRGRFAKIQQLQQAKEREISELQRQNGEALGAMVDAQSGDVDMARVRILNRYITGLNISSLQRQGELRAIQGEVEKRRRELVRARQEVRVLDKLKDRRYQDHLYEENQEEMKIFNEIAIQADWRKKCLEKKLEEQK